MSKIKQLFEEETERRFNNRVRFLVEEEGYTEEAAQNKAAEEEEARYASPE